MRLGTSAVLGTLLLVAPGCQRKFNEGVSLKADAGGTAMRTPQFLNALLAPAGSVERKRASQWFRDRVLHAFPQQGLSESGMAARNALLWTAEALGHGPDEMCKPHERIRLVRGIGAQTVLRSPTAPDRVAYMNPSFVNVAMGELQKAVEAGVVPCPGCVWKPSHKGSYSLLRSMDPGHFLLQNAGALRDMTIENHVSRSLGLPQDPNAFAARELTWYVLGQQSITRQKNDALVSTTINPDVARSFGPGFIVADVCPERAFLRSDPSHTNFAEVEVFVPFFLLPEEIVAVLGQEHAARSETGEPLGGVPDGLPIIPGYPDVAWSPATKIIRQCFLHNDNAWDRPRVHSRILETRFERVQRGFFAAVAKAGSLAEYRARVFPGEVAKVCAPDCETNAAILEDIKVQANAAGRETREYKREVNAYWETLRQSCPNLPKPYGGWFN